jgi:hypothetical protein
VTSSIARRSAARRFATALSPALIFAESAAQFPPTTFGADPSVFSRRGFAADPLGGVFDFPPSRRRFPIVRLRSFAARSVVEKCRRWRRQTSLFAANKRKRNHDDVARIGVSRRRARARRASRLDVVVFDVVFFVVGARAIESERVVGKNDECDLLWTRLV